MCREMGWSWQELMDTPPYVRKAFWDIAQIRRENENARMERGRR